MRAEAYGEALPHHSLKKPFRLLFEETVNSFPERTALVSMWQASSEWSLLPFSYGATYTSTQNHGPIPHASTSTTDLGEASSASTGGPIRWTYAELDRQSEAAASFLQRHGCVPGDSLATVLWNSAEWAVFFWACAKAEMTFVSLDPRTLQAEDMEEDTTYFLETTRPAVIVVQDIRGARAVDRVLGGETRQLKNTSRSIIELKICCSSGSGSNKSGDGVSGLLPPGWVTPHATSSRADPAPGPGSSNTIAHKLNATNDTASVTFAASFRGPEPSKPVPSFGKSSLIVPNGRQNVPEASPSTPTHPALILFTSGTTSTPKACPHMSQNLWSQTFDYDPHPAPLVDRWLVHTPVSHIMGVNNCLRAWRYGHCVVFPSASFDAGTTAEALLGEEKCTFMMAVPAIVKAVLAHPRFRDGKRTVLRYVAMGGERISEEDIRLCKEQLGAENVIQGYGMSEGAPVVSWCRPDPLLVRRGGYHPGVGKALPGAKVRICRPGTRDVISIGEAGELHVGGASVIDRYLGGVDADVFYRDDEGDAWLATGDQARMDEDKVVFITGRLKDLIIRAGENINPAKIEDALNSLPGIVAQVVGALDGIAGEIPVAVIKSGGPLDKELLARTVGKLGARYALEDILSLQHLGLEQFPTTATGKVKKQQLKALVATYLASTKKRLAQAPQVALETACPASKLSSSSSSSIIEPCSHGHARRLRGTSEATACENMQTEVSNVINTLQEIIFELTHVRPSPDEDLGQVTDSITALRYCDRVLNNLGVRLNLQDVASNATLRKQAELVSHRLDCSRVLSSVHVSQVLGKPRAALTGSNAITGKVKLDDVSWLQGEKTPTTTARKARMAVPTLQEYFLAGEDELKTIGLSYEDVEDALPIKEILHRFASGQRPQSYRNRLCYKVSDSSPSQIRGALAAVIRTRPLFRALIARFPDGTPFHLVLKPSDVIFNGLIHETSVETDEECKNLFQDESAAAFSSPLTAHALIISVADTGAMFLRMTLSHAAFDAVSLMPFYSDLDKLLSSPGWSPPPMTPFRLFSDLVSLYATSFPALESVNFHVRRLRGISHLKGSLFPRQKAPGWMISSDELSPNFRVREEVRRKEIWHDWDGGQKSLFNFPRLAKILRLPGLDALKTRHAIQPQVVVKAAVALMNMAATGEWVAVFNVMEAGRSWPFVPDWMHMTLPPITGVDGPTLELVLNVVRMPGTLGRSRKAEGVSVGTWLSRLADEQQELERHAHAPWGAVLDGLGDEADTARDASFRQTLVWDVSLPLLNMAGNYRKLVPVARYDWADWYVLFFHS